MSDSRNGKVPRYKRDRNTNRLLDSKDSPPRRRRRLHSASHPLGLACKPPREAQCIVELTLRLGERLTGLVRNDVGNVIAVLADQSVPLEETLCSCSGVDLFVGLEGLVGGLHCGIDICRAAVGCCGPDFAIAGVCEGQYCDD